jgi:hypothetical protein
VKSDELEVEIQFGRLDPTLGLDVFSFTRDASQPGSLSGRSYPRFNAFQCRRETGQDRI